MNRTNEGVSPMRRSRPRSRFRLFLEQLEDRTVPSGLLPLTGDSGTGDLGGTGSATTTGGSTGGTTGGTTTQPPAAVFGTPWLDATRLSLSFAPDGTFVDNQSSALFSSLGAFPTSVWQTEILRAFQTWAVNANINIGVVNDGGQAFGVSGAVEGDLRFGDIRVGSRVFATHIAMNSPFNVLSDTRAGDLLLNTADAFSIAGSNPPGYDLFHFVLPAVGNILGIPDNLDHSDSAMYHYYNGLKTGLSSYDISNVQSLYGARKADAYEGFYGNGSAFNATTIGTGTILADITTV